MDMGRGEKRVRCMEIVIRKLILSYANGNCCMAQETQTGALYETRGVGWGGRWEGGSKGRGYLYTKNNNDNNNK